MGSSMDSENEKEEKSGNANMLACIAMLTNGKSYPLQNPKMEEGKTTPKKHFTEDSLLSAMERAGSEEMPDEAERKGIGTSATRAATIEKLVRIGFVERKGNKKTKYLLTTNKGVAIHGYVIKMDLADFKELLWLMQISGNNLNQYAKKANETGSIYHEDIEELKKVQNEILLEMRKVLEKLTAII